MSSLEATIRPAVATRLADETADVTTRWWLVILVAAILSGVFYTYEHNAQMYAGGARDGAGEDRLRDKFVDEQATGSLQRKLVVIGYATAGLFALFTCRHPDWNLNTLGVSLLIMLVLWSAASTLIAEETGVSLRRLIATCLTLVGSLGFARLLRPQEVISVALVSMVVMVSASLAIDLAAGGRPWASGNRFGGTLHANSQAMYCGVLCLAAFTQPAGFGSRWMPRVALLGGLFAIYLTRSRTGLVAVVLSLLMTMVVSLSSKVRWAAVALIVSFFALAMVSLASVGTGERAQMRDTILMGRTEQAGSLTGRVPLWQELWGYVEKQPLTGYGYEGFWTPRRIDLVMKSQGWALQSAHNAYLEVLLQIGVIGLGIAMAFVLLAMVLLQRAFDQTKNPGYAFAFGVIVLGMLDSLLQSHFHAVSYPTILALIPMLAVVCFFPTYNSTEGRLAARQVDRNNFAPAPTAVLEHV